MDYSKVKSLYGDEKEFAYKLKDRVKKELGFTVNIGIGNNKLQAKMASELEKPNKINTIAATNTQPITFWKKFLTMTTYKILIKFFLHQGA